MRVPTKGILKVKYIVKPTEKEYKLVEVFMPNNSSRLHKKTRSKCRSKDRIETLCHKMNNRVPLELRF